MNKPPTQHRILLNHQEVKYTLVRRARKTIGLVINQHGLELRAAPQCSARAIQDALLKNADWILNKLAQLPDRSRLADRQTISWLGNTLPIIPEALASKITENACYVAAPNTEEALHVALICLFKKLGLPYLQERTTFWANKMQLMPKKILLSHAHKRWGSCNYQGEIRLNWRLMHFPIACIDYVIIHELGHLREMNHSAQFWQIVAQYCPDYRQQIKKLHHSQHLHLL